MKNTNRASLALASTLLLTALLAACGGGGGGGATPPTNTGGGGGSNSGGGGGTGGGGGGSTPTPPASTPTPIPTASPGGSGTMMLGGNALATSMLVFTCGCTGDGGKLTTDGQGNYTINGVTGASSVLNPGKNYVPSGHNLMIVGYANAPSHTQTWTMMFLGNTPSHNLSLGNNDVPSTAAALYVYYAASLVNNNDKTFDWFNFNQIIAFTQHLRNAPDATETKFLKDVTAAQSASQSLFPVAAAWNSAASSDTTNATILADVQAVAKDAADSTIPTQCPSGPNTCAGAPTP